MSISRNSPCVCGSGLRFKNCCGRVDAPRWSSEAMGRISGSLFDPEHRHLIENEPVCEFDSVNLPPGLFVRWLADDYDWRSIGAGLARISSTRAAEIFTGDGQEVDPERITSIVNQGEWAGPVQAMVRRAYCEEVEPFFNRRLRWFEKPQVLRYTGGGYYRVHSDSDGWDEQAGVWRHVTDRHLSLLIYLDNGYLGGQLVFPNFNFRFQPRAGMLVAFPSDFRYLHGAMPVLSGTRHAVVSWSAVEGEKLLDPKQPPYAVPR